MRLIKRVIARYRAWRDERFRQRIDKVYFQLDQKGNRYIYGNLNAVYDTRNGTPGDVTGWGNLTREDIFGELSDTSD